MTTENRSSDGMTVSTDEINRSYVEELQRKEKLLYKEIEKSKQMDEDFRRVKSLYEREKRQNQQYSNDMEAEMEKRDQELEKREQEIFDLIEQRQRLQLQLGNVKDELADGKQQNQSLAEQLAVCQKQLQDERNKTLPCPNANETALFEAETKVEEYKSTMEKMKTDLNRLINQNCELDDRVHQLEYDLAQTNNEGESLRSLLKTQQNELQDARQLYTELQIQLHQLQSGDEGKEIAPKGNSLFAEVIDGKERLEKQLVHMHLQCNKLRQELIQTTKLAYENAISRAALLDGEVLTGPTLAIFKVIKAEMEMRLNEKQQLLEQLHMLEDAERRGVLKMAKESPAEFNIFQENLNNITRQEKQRLANRVCRLELRELELLESISYEKHRAASVPQLKHRLEQQERLLAHYEKNQLLLDKDQADDVDGTDKENGGGGGIVWLRMNAAAGGNK